MNKKRFIGIAEKEWQEQCKIEEYVDDFQEVTYLIDMINGIIEVKNPIGVYDVRSFNDSTCFYNRDNNYLRFVLDVDDIIDLPKENIIYIQTKYGKRISRLEYPKSKNEL